MFASVTRLRVRSLKFLPPFLWYTLQSQRQVVRSAGFLGGRLLVDSHRTYWTLTLWDSEQAMKKFRGTGAHSRVMSRLAGWCDEAAYAHWTPEQDSVPQWKDAYQHLIAEGRLSRVEHPSADHSGRRFAEPRLRPLIGQDLRASNAKRAA
jgi:hypothetical protein